MTGSLTERYDDRIAGVLSCYDRVVVTGTLPTICYADGMSRFLYAAGIKIFEYLPRTNLPKDDPAKLWDYYNRLVEVEQAFKTLKGDLAIRPVFHQTEARI